MRLLFYVAPFLLLSVILNILKFLKAELVIRQKDIGNNTVIEVIDYDVTELRQDPNYIYYYVLAFELFLYLLFT